MIDKPLFIIISMYMITIGLVGAQFMADSYSITLVTPDGTPIKNPVTEYADIGTVNTRVLNTTQANETTFVLDPVFAGAQIAWNFFGLLTGTYIFNVLYLFGMPPIWIVVIVVPYTFLLINTIIAKIRGI